MPLRAACFSFAVIISCSAIRYKTDRCFILVFLLMSVLPLRLFFPKHLCYNDICATKIFLTATKNCRHFYKYWWYATE